MDRGRIAPYIGIMRAKFWKMHGLGNDFVVFDDRAATLNLTPTRIAALANRRTGIGCDQFITLEKPSAGADVFMRIHNPDGSESGACGNATRCVAELIGAELGQDQIGVRTIAGDLSALRRPDGLVAVDMGKALLDWADVPLARAMDTLHLPLPGDPASCSMGNPHATFFVDDLATAQPEARGPSLENDPLFPQRANIGFAQILAPDRIRLRVWERGAGLTLACGTGACATLVNAHRRGLAERAATVIVDGGEMHIAWRPDGHVVMTGSVATSFIGETDLDTYPQ